jgi:hypothetical protein
MQQCEDRCYRIGQKKDVSIVYHDVDLTIDDAMRKKSSILYHFLQFCLALMDMPSQFVSLLAPPPLFLGYINEGKSTNAAIILSDKIALSDNSISFKDMSGAIGRTVSAFRRARMSSGVYSADQILAGTMAPQMPSIAKQPPVPASKHVIVLDGPHVDTRVPASKRVIVLDGPHVDSKKKDSAAAADMSKWACPRCASANEAMALACSECHSEKIIPPANAGMCIEID